MCRMNDQTSTATDPIPDSKPFWQSKTLIGLLVMLMAPLAIQHIPGLTDADLTDFITKALELVGSGLVVYGRLRASKTLTLSPSNNSGPSLPPGPNKLASLILVLGFAGLGALNLTSCAQTKQVMNKATAAPSAQAIQTHDQIKAQVDKWLPRADALISAKGGWLFDQLEKDQAAQQEIAGVGYVVVRGVRHSTGAATFTDSTVLANNIIAEDPNNKDVSAMAYGVASIYDIPLALFPNVSLYLDIVDEILNGLATAAESVFSKYVGALTPSA